MKKNFNYLFKHGRDTVNCFQKHGKKYLFGRLGVFTIAKVVLLFLVFFATLDLGKSSAQAQVVLTKNNIVSMGCATIATECNLARKGITSIESDAFVNHTQLLTLYLSYNQLTGVDGVGFPDSLQKLDFYSNQLTSLSGVEFPDSLQFLSLGENQLTSLSGVEFPDSLQELDLYDNQLTSLDGVGFPDSLKTLYLSNNQLTNLDGVRFPDSLTKLVLQYNQLTSLDGVGFPDSLQELDLSYNQLTSLDGVNFPNSLTDLELSNNQLTSVDRVEFPDSLQSLYLSNNQLTSVDRVEFPDSLQSLYLSYNQLTSVDRVEFPDSLQELDLSRNPLTSLDGVEFPNSLGYLGLSNNCIDPLSLSQEDRNFITTRNYNNPSWMNEQYVCLGIEYNPSTSTSNPVTASLAPYGPANKIQALLDDNGGSLSQRDEVFDINGSRLIDFSTIVDTGTNLRLNNVPIGYDNNLDPIYGDKELMATVDRIITRPSGGGGGGWRTPTPTNPEKEHGSASGEDEKKDDDDFETKFNELVEQINQTDANKYPDELLEAYAYSYLRGITTMSTIEKADMYGLLTRIALAKMMSNYVLSEGLQELDTSKECKFPDVPESLDAEYDNGMTKACQLGLMGVDITKFNPYKIVSRAELATVLSRALRGAKYNGGIPFYTKHIQALKDKEIMTKIENPEQQELRAWTMLILMRIRKSSIK